LSRYSGPVGGIEAGSGDGKPRKRAEEIEGSAETTQYEMEKDEKKNS